jgi:hypothetical protein
MIAYSIQCAYNSFKTQIKRDSLISYEDISLHDSRYVSVGLLRDCVNANIKKEKRDELSLDYKVWIEHSLDKLTEKVNQDKNDFKRMYWANIYDILITHKGNILKAQRQIKLPYFEVRKAVREYEQYLKDYFKNKIKTAVYVHCHAHKLNLALCDASLQIKDVSDIIDVIENVSVFVRRSAKRQALFEHIKEKTKKERLKLFCDTR